MTMLEDLEHDAKARGLLRARLRAARGAALANAEGFEVVVHAIEAVGRALDPDGHGLADYTPALMRLVTSALGWSESGKRSKRLAASLFLLRQSRNDHAHRGVHARNATDEAVRVALILEDALSFNWEEVRLGDLMVRRPVVADVDESLADVRRTILGSSFSFVPVRIEGRWRLVSERWLAGLLVGKVRRERERVLESRVYDFKGALGEAAIFQEDTPLSALPTPLPELLLVAEREGAKVLLGVVSPSDLL